MEMHHKLRRDPNWHPSACNICGHMGHQAAQCTNGTVNWRQLYGDEFFRLKEPLYETDLLKMRKEKEIDLAALEKRAKEYAAMQASGGAQPVAAAAAPAVPAIPAVAIKQPAGEAAPGPSPVAATPAAAAVTPPAAAADPAALPPGWAPAKDQAGRTYYWHTQTKKVTWEKPTADTPTAP